MAPAGQELRRCPICENDSFAPTEQTFDLADVLKRWESEAGIRFADTVWAEYTRPTPKQVTLHRCSVCWFAYFEPGFPGSTDFYKCITTVDGSCYTAQKWEFQQAIKDIGKHGCQRVLDIGSGSGFFLDMLSEERPQVDCVGFEFNQDMIQLIKAKGHKMRYGQSPDVLLPEMRGSFDAVCIFQVLEHAADPVALIEITRQLLRPGGLLIIAVPDNAGPVKYFSDALTELPPHHLSRWRSVTFKRGLPRFGFKVLSVLHEPLPAYLWRDYLPVILEHSVLPKRLGRALSKNDRLTRFLKKLRLNSLYGVRGHSVYVRAKLA